MDTSAIDTILTRVPDLMTVHELARATRAGAQGRGLLHAVRAGDLAAVRINARGDLRITREAARAYLLGLQRRAAVGAPA